MSALYNQKLIASYPQAQSASHHDPAEHVVSTRARGESEWFSSTHAAGAAWYKERSEGADEEKPTFQISPKNRSVRYGDGATVELSKEDLTGLKAYERDRPTHYITGTGAINAKYSQKSGRPGAVPTMIEGDSLYNRQSTLSYEETLKVATKQEAGTLAALRKQLTQILEDKDGDIEDLKIVHADQLETLVELRKVNRNPSSKWLASNTDWTKNAPNHRSKAVSDHDSDTNGPVTNLLKDGGMWNAGQEKGPDWVVFNMGEDYVLSKFELRNPPGPQSPKNCEFLAFSGGEWLSIATWEGPYDQEDHVIEFNPHVAREWKLVVKDTHGGLGASIIRVKFYGYSKASSHVVRGLTLEDVKAQAAMDMVREKAAKATRQKRLQARIRGTTTVDELKGLSKELLEDRDYTLKTYRARTMEQEVEIESIREEQNKKKALAEAKKLAEAESKAKEKEQLKVAMEAKKVADAQKAKEQEEEDKRLAAEGAEIQAREQKREEERKAAAAQKREEDRLAKEKADAEAAERAEREALEAEANREANERKAAQKEKERRETEAAERRYQLEKEAAESKKRRAAAGKESSFFDKAKGFAEDKSGRTIPLEEKDIPFEVKSPW